MRICDICKTNPGQESQFFNREIKDFRFSVQVFVSPPSHIGCADICEDCAAKAALMVLGVEPPKPADKP